MLPLCVPNFSSLVCRVTRLITPCDFHFRYFRFITFSLISPLYLGNRLTHFTELEYFFHNLWPFVSQPFWTDLPFFTVGQFRPSSMKIFRPEIVHPWSSGRTKKKAMGEGRHRGAKSAKTDAVYYVGIHNRNGGGANSSVSPVIRALPWRCSQSPEPEIEIQK